MNSRHIISSTLGILIGMSAMAAKGLKDVMWVFSGQHNPHFLNEYADLGEMLDAYKLLIAIIQENAL